MFLKQTLENGRTEFPPEWGGVKAQPIPWREPVGNGAARPARADLTRDTHPAPATMPREGTQTSTAQRREEEPPQSPDGTGSDTEAEPPPGRAGPRASATAGEERAETAGKQTGGSGSAPNPGLARVFWRGRQGLRGTRLKDACL